MNSSTSSFKHFTLLNKTSWIKFNRILAWAMVFAPVVQFFVRAKFAHAMQVDIGLLAAHGILSLVLFGLPKVKYKNFIFSMHVMGFLPHPLSPRHDFLFTGYRVTLSTLAGLLALVPDLRWLALWFFYPLLNSLVFVRQHLKSAINYALKRWGMKDRYSGLIATVYIVFSAINLLRR